MKMSFMRGITLKQKLVFSFVLIVILYAITSWVYTLQVRKVQTQITNQNVETDKKVLAMELKETVQELEILTAELILTKDISLVEEHHESNLKLQQYVTQIGETASTKDQRQWKAMLQLVSKEFTDHFDRVLSIIQNNNLTEENKTNQIENSYKMSQAHKSRIFELVDNFYEDYAIAADAAVTESESELSKTVTFSKATLPVITLITVLVAALLTRSFTKPIHAIQKAMHRISEGDLRYLIHTKRNDELGILSKDVDRMIIKVREMLSRSVQIASSLTMHSQSFKTSSKKTAVANNDILKAIQEIAAGADQQAEHSEQSAQWVHDLDQRLNTVRETADTIFKNGKKAMKITKDGVTAISSTQKAASATNEVLREVNDSFQLLSDKMKEIEHIVSTMKEISGQTNVLALNASIEAAKAGHHGKGFSVIAEQIRLLSNQSNVAASNISKIVSNLEQQVKEVDHRMDSIKATVSTQHSSVQSAFSAFQEIYQSVNDMHDLIESIHSQTEKAKKQNAQLVGAIQFVASIAEETAAGVQEVHSTSNQQNDSIQSIAEQADDIDDLASQLFEQINRFKLNDSEDNMENNHRNEQ